MSNTRPDLADVLQRLSNELRDLAARVGKLEQRADGFAAKIDVIGNGGT